MESSFVAPEELCSRFRSKKDLYNELWYDGKVWFWKYFYSPAILTIIFSMSSPLYSQAVERRKAGTFINFRPDIGFKKKRLSKTLAFLSIQNWGLIECGKWSWSEKIWSNIFLTMIHLNSQSASFYLEFSQLWEKTKWDNLSRRLVIIERLWTMKTRMD